MTHADLVAASRRWLSRQCPIVITEMANMGGEEADAIGWAGLLPIMIECKATREDFRRDAAKPFRTFPASGLGVQRYYCTPKGMLAPGMMPDRWGLLEFTGSRMLVTRKPIAFSESNRVKEISLLLSALRRTGTHAPSGVSVKVYTVQTKCRATLTVQTEEII